MAEESISQQLAPGQALNSSPEALRRFVGGARR